MHTPAGISALGIALIASAGWACTHERVIPAPGESGEVPRAADGATRVGGATEESTSTTGPRIIRSRAPERALCAPRTDGLTSVYFGTTEPTFLELAPGQISAIGRVQRATTLCSGTLIASNWVITARHCTSGAVAQDITFHMGRSATESIATVHVQRIIEHPQTDLSLLELEMPATDLLPDVIPLRIMTQTIHVGWAGSMAEAAGYGQDELGNFGERSFTAEPIVTVAPGMITVDGQGRHGLCFGDSGGPLMTRAQDGSVRVVGVLSGGDGSCVGRDNFTRVDAWRTWVESFTGTTPLSDAAGCGTLTEIGRCIGGMAVWCGLDESVHTEACAGGTSCGWDDVFGVFACVDDDPCAGIDSWGACDDQVATWCDRGQLKRADCSECGRICGFAAEQGGVTCQDDPCAALGTRGRCSGDVLTYCDSGGEIQAVDCGANDRSCEYDAADERYHCM